MKDWCRIDSRGRGVLLIVSSRLHINTTGEPLQMLQCKGGLRGVSVFGRMERVAMAHFGAGRRIYIDLLWIATRYDSR